MCTTHIVHIVSAVSPVVKCGRTTSNESFSRSFPSTRMPAALNSAQPGQVRIEADLFANAAWLQVQRRGDHSTQKRKGLEHGWCSRDQNVCASLTLLLADVNKLVCQLVRLPPLLPESCARLQKVLQRRQLSNGPPAGKRLKTGGVWRRNLASCEMQVHEPRR